MALSGFIGRRNIQGIKVEIEFPPEVYANTDFPIKIKVKNRKKFLPTFLLRVYIENASVLFLLVEKEEEITTNFKIDKRGSFKLDKVNVCSVFPFSFFIRCQTYKVDVEKTVFPQPKRCDLLEKLIDSISKKKGEKITDKPGYEGDIISIKDYTASTPMKFIHWKASAKTDSLKEKELSQTGSTPIIVDFDKLSYKNLEEKLSCITYTVLKASNSDIELYIKYKTDIFYTKDKNQRLRFLNIIANL
ncbi:MAG: DUF58 domain-containing protein [Hydrogenothermaceae bacterium]|nr:DUF58 domain-containing protein [Hydrogenothermaceae bacterium]